MTIKEVKALLDDYDENAEIEFEIAEDVFAEDFGLFGDRKKVTMVFSEKNKSIDFVINNINASSTGNIKIPRGKRTH